MAKKINIIANLIDKQFKRQVKELENGNYKINVDVNGENVSKTTNNVRQLGSATASTDTAFGKLKSTIKDTFSAGRMSMTVFLAALHEINKAGKNAKQTIEDINKSITDLAIATNMSREATAGLVKEYNDYAKELKSTTVQVSQAADDYLRAGKSMSEAKELIKDSIMLSKLGQIDSSAATEDLLATMNGYEMSIKDVGNALDAMVAIDMNAATSAGDLATGLKYSASSANSAGVSFNKLVAILGTVQDKTMQNAEVIGTFANTMLSRYRDVTIGKYLSDDGEDISNYESVLKSVGITLRDKQGEFIEFETVLQEMADKWNTLSSVQQNALIKVAAGTRQQNRFIALMEGYNKVLELTETAANSAGMAVDKFNNAFANSLEARQNELQASFEAMIMNSDMEEVYTGILDATKALVDFMNETNALKGVMTGLAVSGGIKFFLSVRSGINEAYISLNQFANALKIVKQTKISTTDFDRLLLLSKGLSESQMKLLLSSKNLTLAQKEQILVNSGLSSEEAKLQLETWGLTTAQNGLTVATTTVGNAFKGLFATMAANPIMLVTMAVSAGVMAYQSYNQKLEETRQKNIQASDSAIEHANSLRELYSEYSRLSSIQNRTSSEEDEFRSVVEKVTEALGNKAEKLSELTIGTKEYADALAKATKEELQSASTDATVGRKSAEEEFQGNIWSKRNGSQISIDSNSKGKALSDEAQKAVDVVSDALKEFETVNRTWKNISWDISSNDPEEAIKYYDALVKAREELVAQNDESLLDTEIYKDINDAINTMSDSMEVYISKRYEELKLSYMVKNGIPQTTDEYKMMEKQISASVESSSALQNRFRSLLTTDFSDLASGIQSVADAQQEVAEQATKSFTKSEMISSINELSEGFEELDKIFSSISDKNPFDFKLLDDDKFKETFSGLGKSYEDFVETISSSPNDINACRDAFNDLVTEWINGSGILDNVNESTAQLTISMLENMGVANAEELVMASLTDKTEALALQEQFLAEYGYEIANASQYRIDAFLNEAGASETARQYLFALVAQEQVFNNQGLDVSGKISALKDLATQYGQTALAAKIAHAEEQAQKSHTSLTASDYANFAEEVNSAMSRVQVDYAGGNKSNKSGGGSSKDAWKEAYEKELAELEHLHEMGLISDEEYYNQRIALNEKYFGEASGKHEKYLQEYRKNEEQIADGLKKLWEDYWNDYKDNLDKVSSYAEKLFQRQIDELNKKKDNSDDSYEKEIESIESVIKRLEDKRDKEKEYWRDQIDAIQKEIDSLQDANDERERALNLQKKMYELQRAMAQRSILQYSQEKGFHYVTNDSEIKDKKEEAEQAKFDITIANLQKQKDALEDKLDEITDKYDVQIEKLNYRKETIEKNMDAENKRIQEQIDLLEEQKSKWTEVADNIEFAMLEKEMLEKYGSDVTQKILGGDVQFLNDFISQYEHATGVINSLNNATLNDIMNMAGQFGVYAENLGGVADIAKEVADKQSDASAQVTQASDSIDTSNMQSQIANAGSSADSASVQIQGVVDKLNGLATEASNISIPALNSSDFATSVEGVIKQLEELKGKFSTISDEIKASWNNMIGGIVGTSSSGNGDPLAGGTSSNSYSDLFTPLEKEIDAANLIIDGKLKELQGLWTQFQGNLAGIIGVGDGTGDSSGQTGAPSISLNAGESKSKGSDKGKDSKSETSGADTVVGAIQTGGQMIDDTFKNEWIPSFSSMGSNINDICSKIVACVNEMAEETVNACRAAIDAINKANAAKNSSSSNNEKPPKFEGSSYVGQAFANGTNGLAHDEKNALRSEYGQPELTVYPNGEYEVTNKPTISDLPKDTVIFNEEQTKKILSNKGSENTIENFIGSTFRKGTVLKRPEHSILDDTEEMKAFWLSNQIMQEILQPISNVNKNVEMMASNISKINNDNSRQSVQFSTGDIIVQGVQNVDGFAKAVKTRFPNAMIQALNTTR